MAQPEKSKFAWTDSGAQSLILDLHVQQVTPAKFRSTFAARSIDGTVIEVISIGSGVNEITCFIMAEGDATGLRDMLDAMRRGISMTFTPDFDNSSGTTFTVTAVAPVPLVQMETEGQQSPLYTCGPLRLARLDGGAFVPAS